MTRNRNSKDKSQAYVARIVIRNFGKIESLDWSGLGTINVIVGRNGVGKTFVLKSLYSAMKTIEAVGRGDSRKSVAEILNDKLFWTFQTGSLGALVRYGSETLDFQLETSSGDFSYRLSRESVGLTSSDVHNTCASRRQNTAFVPAKEALSLCNVVRKSREVDEIFGFDDTYLDLVRAVSIPTRQGKNLQSFASARDALRKTIGGKIEFDSNARAWLFRDASNQTYSIGATSEGVKKIAILDQLLGNRYLSRGSVLIFDEPESGVHPGAVSELVEILWELANDGVQIFLATHSYFVIKKLYVLALRNRKDIPFLSFYNDADRPWIIGNLRDGTSDIEIVSESVRLYQEEVDEVL